LPEQEQWRLTRVHHRLKNGTQLGVSANFKQGNLLAVGPGKPTCDTSKKKVSVAVTVALGGGNTAVEVDPAKVEAD